VCVLQNILQCHNRRLFVALSFLLLTPVSHLPQDLLAAADIGEMLLEKNRALNILMAEMQTKLEEKSETRRYTSRADGDEPVAQRERVKTTNRARAFVSTRNKVM